MAKFGEEGSVTVGSAGLTPEQVEDVHRLMVNHGGHYPDPVVSYKAYKMAQRIHEIKPHLILDSECAIWYYAKELGLK